DHPGQLAPRDPGRHDQRPAAEPPDTGDPSQTIFTCPMHPEIRRAGPGDCPICGMALEPVVAAPGSGESAELRDMTRRFRIGLLLAGPVFLLGTGSHLADLHHLVPPQLSNVIQLVLATPVVWWAGWPFFRRAWASIVNRSLNMFTLVA